MKLFIKKETRCLTGTGWLLLMGATAGFLFMALVRLYPFLSPSQPVFAEVLVVEGWLEDAELAQVLNVFEAGGYRKLVATGGEVAFGRDFIPYPSYAEMTYHRLLHAGVPAHRVDWTTCGDAARDRTYCAALALRDLLTGCPAIDLISSGPHARRSRRLFQLAMGDACEVGIIAIEPQAFNGGNWWKCSDGFRRVIDESIAWFYARWIFKPEKVNNEE